MNPDKWDFIDVLVWLCVSAILLAMLGLAALETIQ